MDRFVLTDAQWEKIEPHCLGKKSDPGGAGRDGRLFVEAIRHLIENFFSKSSNVFMIGVHRAL